MKQKPYQEYLVGQRGYKQVGDACCGLEDGFAVTVTPTQNYGTLQVTVAAQLEDWKATKQELKQELKPYHAAPDPGKNSVAFIINLKDFTQDFPLALEAFLRILRAQGARPDDVCPICKTQGCDSVMWYKGAYRPLHAGCAQTVVEATAAETRANQDLGSHLTGFFGALLGALVGTIPSVLTVLFAEKIWAVLFALIPLAAAWGYRKCKGKQDKGGVAIIVVLSLLGVYFLQIMVAGIQLVQEYGAGILPLLGAYLAEPQAWVDMTTGSVVEFIFIALGLWFAWRNVSMTNEDVQQSLEATRATLQPYGQPVEK